MVQTNERLYKWTNERPNGRLNYVVCREWTCRTLRTLWTLRACNKYNLNGANKQTSCKKVKVSQLFVIQINLLQNSGNLAKRPKSTILSFSLHFGIFNFYAIFVFGYKEWLLVDASAVRRVLRLWLAQVKFGNYDKNSTHNIHQTCKHGTQVPLFVDSPNFRTHSACLSGHCLVWNHLS